MRHPTYKHLEGRLRLGAFSIGQWAQIAVAAVAAALFGGYVSPFGAQVTIFVSIVGAGIPIAVSYGAMGLEFSVTQLARAAWRYRRHPRRFMPGPGLAVGYTVSADPDPAAGAATGAHPSEGAVLWDV